MSKEIQYLKTPLGLLKITVKHDKLISIKYINKKQKKPKNIVKTAVMKKTILQLEEYFNQTRKKFSIPLEIQGTKFQKDVYNALLEVNYGKVISYKRLAKKAGHSGAYRAVGSAMKKNKIPIIIPCHRVIKSDKTLGNYTGGVWLKEKLLSLEDSEFF